MDLLPTNTLFFEHRNSHGKVPGLTIFIDPNRYQYLKPLIEECLPGTGWSFQGEDLNKGWLQVEFWNRLDAGIVNRVSLMADRMGVRFAEVECFDPYLLSPPNSTGTDGLEVLFEDGFCVTFVTLTGGVVLANKSLTGTSVAALLHELRPNHGRVEMWEHIVKE